jgi:hypothetical protein
VPKGCGIGVNKSGIGVKRSGIGAKSSGIGAKRSGIGVGMKISTSFMQKSLSPKK